MSKRIKNLYIAVILLWVLTMLFTLTWRNYNFFMGSVLPALAALFSLLCAYIYDNSDKRELKIYECLYIFVLAPICIICNQSIYIKFILVVLYSLIFGKILAKFIKNRINNKKKS